MTEHTPIRDEIVLEARGLTKRYGEREAVRGVDRPPCTATPRTRLGPPGPVGHHRVHGSKL
ncbi:hypothetical protein [Microbispora sp. GKU 823]|uniref:hypothetical protein n=1 Tax=Microbispora sp. GKU 823 TaxID=1652100 RepID=UPI0009A2F60D|nr:hypothetical protein [Microbispora sp. GKU 823]OPG09267.1 hypothetical protein B1L11_26565 [Microbispora sp. GKU 823]